MDGPQRGSAQGPSRADQAECESWLVWGPAPKSHSGGEVPQGFCSALPGNSLHRKAPDPQRTDKPLRRSTLWGTKPSSPSQRAPLRLLSIVCLATNLVSPLDLSIERLQLTSPMAARAPAGCLWGTACGHSSTLGIPPPSRVSTKPLGDLEEGQREQP